MKRWFQISSVEEKGFWLLNVIILLLVLNKIFKPFEKDVDHAVDERVEQAFLDFVAKQNLMDSVAAMQKGNKKEVPIETVSNTSPKSRFNGERFLFNPNTASKEDLVRLGFRNYQAKNVVAYRNAGGAFSNPEDLKNIYGMYAPLIDSLAPWMQFAEKSTSKEKIPIKGTSHRNRDPVNLNTADTTALKSLYGIGGYYAKKIVEYREALGGFVDTLQLLEIWRLDSAIFIKNPGRIVLGNSQPIRVNLNTVTRQELAQHPYISWKQANNIVAYREQHGPYQALEEITRTVLIDAQDYVKIAPYFTVE